MQQNLERYLNPLAMSAVLAGIVFVYAAATLDPHYQGEDYLFVSQVSRLGFVPSIALSWKDHFLPLYRIVMGGLHLLFHNAIPIRVAILIFHLANTVLVYHIVHSRTRSIALSTVAATAIGFSEQSASELLFPINGHWVMSLTFLLAMSIYFERLLQSQSSPGLKKPAESEETEDKQLLDVPDTSRAQPTTRDLTDITMQPATWHMNYYYAGLLCFAIGLGFFTIALAGGAVIWVFTYVRLLRQRDFRQSLRLQAKTVLPFAAIVGSYLLMRSHFNELSRPYLDSMTLLIVGKPAVTLAEALRSIAELPASFYASAVEQAMPSFGIHYVAILILLAVLLIKEIVFRKKEVGTTFMWLGFSAVSIVMPAFGRLFFILRGSANIEDLLFPWYFYVPVAGVSIALGLLLRPPPVIEKKVGECSTLMRALLFVVVVAILAALNFNTVKEIRTLIPPLIKENQRFNGLLARYKNSMTSFLNAPEYSPGHTYYFKDPISAGQNEFPMSWYVMHHDIFYLYFPEVENVHFISGFTHYGDLYFWSPDGITKKHWQGRL